LRLVEIERPLAKAVNDYIRQVYGKYLEYLPEIIVYSEREWIEELGPAASPVAGVYDMENNTLIFRQGFARTPRLVAREVHHWYQAQREGPERFRTEMGIRDKRERYEVEAREAARLHQGKLGEKMETQGIRVIPVKEALEKYRQRYIPELPPIERLIEEISQEVLKRLGLK